MLIDHWPLFGLRLSTPRLELRLPHSDELAELADLAAAGVHGPEMMPFSSAWTDLPPVGRARAVIQQHCLRVGSWTPDNWSLNLAVFKNGRVVGAQALAARSFDLVREVNTASWLGLPHQGRGLGTEMRAAVLFLAFAGLGAAEATTGAFLDNTASLAVSRKLGYRHDGTERRIVRGQATIMRRLRLTREQWEAHRTLEIDTVGLAPCLPLFGAAGEDGTFSSTASI
ncbi:MULTISPECIES: GNAT family N-acetyltransferase [unclassified Kitasatospora]|uniref:GNAT family N-acetyltransferase n=1 Tax=unclassified Kitasatospora TaxID=2633591 RepID=UPI0037F15DB5